jgi:hypothetical protein
VLAAVCVGPEFVAPGAVGLGGMVVAVAAPPSADRPAVPGPLVLESPPGVGAWVGVMVCAGGWQVFVVTVVTTGTLGSVATGGGAPPSGMAVGLATAVPWFAATQVQADGQSASAVQIETLAWQYPGKEVIVVQVTGADAPASMSAGAGTGPVPVAPPAPAEAPPLPAVAVALPPEHMPISLGLQVKPSPQSASTLHGSSHWYAHRHVVVVVQSAG